MNNFCRGPLVVLLALVASACSITPTVRYDLIQKPSDKQDDDFDTFYLQGSKLTIAKVDALALTGSGVETQTPAAGNPPAANSGQNRTVADKKGKGTPTAAGQGSSGTAGHGSGSGGVGGTGGGGGQPPESGPYRVFSTPVEPSLFPAVHGASAGTSPWKIGIAHDDHFWSSTNITIGKADNTDLVTSVGTDVTDNRVTTIATIAEIASKAAPLFLALSAGENDPVLSRLPYSMDVTKSLDDLEKSNDEDAGRDVLIDAPLAGLVIKYAPAPVDAEWLYGAAMKFPFSSHQFIFSACRTAEVSLYDVNGNWEKDLVTWVPDKKTGELKSTDGKKTLRPVYTGTVKVADPHFIQMVEMPVKGNVKTASQCGISVESQPGQTNSDLEILKAVVTNAQTVANAYKAGAASQSDSGKPKGK